VGLGETEQEMAEGFQRVYDLGGVNHLFSFFPEAGSAAETREMPPMDVYRRIQIACELIDSARSRADRMSFDSADQIVDFGVRSEVLKEVISSGEAFRTRGCEGRDGQVACNRPYANSLPGDNIRNYPFTPEEEDIARIREQLGTVS
jgi:biotin synthase-related radical SAM superfamily protein